MSEYIPKYPSQEGDDSNKSSSELLAETLKPIYVPQDLMLAWEMHLASYSSDTNALLDQVRDSEADLNTQYQALLTRVQRYEQMLQDITMDSNEFTMDTDEVNFTGWNILAQASYWDYLLRKEITKLSDQINGVGYRGGLVSEVTDAILEGLVVDNNYISNVIGALSDTPLIRELDAALNSTTTSLSELQEEYVRLAEKQVADAESLAHQQVEKAEQLVAAINAAIAEQLDRIAQEAAIRTQLLQELEDRANEMAAQVDSIREGATADKASILETVSGYRTELKSDIATVNSSLLGALDGVNASITETRDGNSATLNELTTYKSSNDVAVAGILSKVTTNISDTAANASKITGLTADLATTNAELGTVRNTSANALSKADTAVTANSALATRVDSLSAAITDLGEGAETTVDVYAFNVLKAEVGTNAAGVSSLVEQVNALGTNYTNLADGVQANTDAVSTLTVKQSEMNGDISQLSSDVTYLTSELGVTNTALNTKASNQALNNLNTALTTTDGKVAANTQQLTQLNTDFATVRDGLETKASTEALNNLATEVTELEGGLAVNASAITSLKSEIDTELDKKATVTAVNGLTTKVEEVEGKTRANANNILALNTSVGNIVNGLATKLDASTISDYYTKSQTDDKAAEVAAGKVEEFRADLKIGGRNLWNPGETISAYESSGSYTHSNDAHRFLPTYLEVSGSKLLLQTWNPNKVINKNYSNRVAFYTEDKTYISSSVLNLLSGETYQKQEFNIPANAKYMRLSVISGVSTYDQSIKFKFELGTVYTEWTASEEEVANAISSNSTAIQNTNAEVNRVDGRVTATNSAQTLLEGRLQFVEGDLTKKADVSALNTLGTEVSDLDGKLSLNTSSITQLQGSLDNVNDDLSNKASLTALNSLSGNVETIGNQTIVNTNALTNLKNRVDVVEGAVAVKLDASVISDYYTRGQADDKSAEIAAGKIESYDANLVIGGANLALNTGRQLNQIYWEVTTTSPVIVGKEYTLSFDYIGNVSGVVFLNNSIVKNYPAVNSTTWVRASVTFVFVKNDYSGYELFPHVYGATNLRNLKLEVGNKATDWTPNDQEVQQSINANANAIQTVNVEVARVNGEVVATANSVSTLSSNVGLLRGSINEVRQTVTNNQESTNILVTSLRSGMADADDVSMMMRNATVLFEDLTFRDGYNGVTMYNHQANGALACNFTDKLPDNPVAATRQLQFIHSGGATAPALGGYYQITRSRPNGVFLLKFVAKLPVGFSFDLAANAYGDEATCYFIGGNAGTGKFKTYYAVYRCGATGSFSAISYVYVNGQHPTPENPLIWYLASSTVYDCLDSKVAPDSVVNGIAEAKSTASTAVNKSEATALIAQELRSALDETNVTISTNYYTKADTDTAIAGKVEEFSSSLEVGGVNRYNHLAPVIENYAGIELQINPESAPNGFFMVGQAAQTGTTRISNVITEKGWWTVSFYIRGSQSVTAGFMLDICDTVRVRVSSNADNTWKRITHSKYVDRVDSVYNFVDIEDVDWAYVYVKDFKIEKGNVATAWTPYPKLLENSVATIKSTYVTQSELNSSIAAQSTEITSKLSRMTEDNLLYNPDFREGSTKGWAIGNHLDSYSIIRTKGGYLDQYNVDAGLSETFAIHSVGVSSGYVELDQRVIVRENRRYQVSCYAAAHRCPVTVFCYFYRADGSIISNSPTWEPQQRVNANEALGGKNLYDYKRIYQNVTTPVGTHSMSIIIRRDGGDDTYMFVTRAQLVEIFDDNLVPWQSSSVQDNATIKETTQSINGIEAIKTVTIDNNGVMSGYGLISQLKNGQVTSAFGVNADTFYIGAPNLNKKPFIHRNDWSMIDGVWVPPGTYIDTALIANATIGTAKIADLAVTNAKILDATIESAKIKTIKADKIEIGNPLVGPITSAMVTGTYLTNAANLFNGTVAANATFATYGTGTQSDAYGAETHYIQVDVGSTVTMPEVRFFFRGSTGRKTYIKIKASTDGVNWDYIIGSVSKWETIDDMPPGPGSDYSTVTIQVSFTWYGVKPYRYLRLYGNGSNASATNELVAIIGNASGSVTKIGSEGILTNSITADKINVTNLSAISANLGTIQVGTANIDSLAVTTLKIQDEAVTVPSSVENNSTISFGAFVAKAGGVFKADLTQQLAEWEAFIGNALTITVNRSGGKCRIDAVVSITSQIDGAFSINDGAGGTISAQNQALARAFVSIYVGSTLIARGSLSPTLYGGTSGWAKFNGEVLVLSGIDTEPRTGNTTYTMKVGFGNIAGSTPRVTIASNGSNAFQISARRMSVLELKK